jgi:sugar phosphate isomerase/epimerase
MSFFKSIQKALGVEDAPEAPQASMDLDAARAVLEAAGFSITETIGIEDQAETIEVTTGDVTDGMALMAQEIAELKAQLKTKVGAPSGGGEGSSKPAKGQPSAAQAKFISKLSPLVELLKQN